MISREWTEPAIAVAVEEWHRGRVADPTLAPDTVPELSHVAGYSLDDVRYNCVGQQSPAQRRQWRNLLAGNLVGYGFGIAITGIMVAHGAGIISLLILVLCAGATLKTLVDAVDLWAGHVSQVDGDITTEVKHDSDGPDHHWVHIEDLRLEVTRDAYWALVPGGPYRIFYVRQPGRAIGGQVLPGWRPLPQVALSKKGFWERFSLEISG